jgi:hypothetical protein
MHRLLTEHPVYQRALEEVARIRGAQALHRQRTEQAEREYREAQAAYQRDAVAALREGREAPERPVPPEVDVALIQQLAQDVIEAPAIVREAERGLAPELLPRLEERAFEVEETVRELADTMRGLAREAGELRVTAAAHRAAADLPPLVNPGAVDVAGLVDLVLHGHRLLDAEPASWSETATWDLTAPRGSHKIASFSPLAGRR